MVYSLIVIIVTLIVLGLFFYRKNNPKVQVVNVDILSLAIIKKFFQENMEEALSKGYTVPLILKLPNEENFDLSKFNYPSNENSIGCFFFNKDDESLYYQKSVFYQYKELASDVKMAFGAKNLVVLS